MATTKKVESARSLRKKAVPTKSAVSVRTKTPKTKKVLKKTPVTVAKKAAPKNIDKKLKTKLPVRKVSKKTNRKNTVDKNVVTIKDKTTSLKTFEEKLKTSPTKRVKKENTTENVKKKNLLPSFTGATTSLALLSVARFPVSLDTFAIQTARIGGVMIVVMGAFFTLLYSQYIWNTPIIASSVSGVQMMGNTTGCSSEATTDSSHDACETETIVPELTHTSQLIEPPITFDVIADESLSKTVPIQIFVDHALSVDVSVRDKSNTNVVPLGVATKVSQGVWEYKWDTSMYDDGSYKVIADVKNVYTTGSPYRDETDEYLSVRNIESTSQSQATTSISISEDVDTAPHVEIQHESHESIVGEAVFQVKVENALKVALIAQHVSSGIKSSLGTARLVSDGLWKYTWSTKSFDGGLYAISAKVTNQYGSYYAGETKLTVASKDIHDEPIDELYEEEKQELIDVAEDSLDKIVSTNSLPQQEIPKVTLQVMEFGTLSGNVALRVDVDAADFVEIWMVPEGSQTRKIIGLAKSQPDESDRWVLQWDTSRVPNASYKVTARVKNDFGLYESNTEKVTVFNTPYIPKQTDEQQKEIEQIAIAQKIEKTVTNEMRDTTVESEKVELDGLETEDEADESVATKSDTIDKLLSAFRDEIDDELQRLVVTYRTNDSVATERAEARIEELRKKILTTSLRDTGSGEHATEIDERISEMVSEHKVLSKRAEVLITERVGKDVFKDSDADGISDYDEQTLYKTDPFTADSDADGFIDGVEVAEGFDPLDSKREAAVTYESPKEKGVVREDILEVLSIESVVPKEVKDDTDGVDAQAVISGKALPNSFVTLYIFSTPVVVTVKTEEDGSWKYRFDKELEDGEHNIYVGLTDNAGRIVAKSKPFTFVKEAQAFSPAEASIVGVVTTKQTDDSLISTYMIYLILSISVVSIGLVLILLGLHLDTRQRRFTGVVTIEEES